ncbi:amidoligase family protein, partial [Thomasclavelia ramosa]|uniref:amidoligase family protein n=1 Tax=Thomasclavelia ramosa TaxID=1547 RepID=UPI0022E61E79
LVLFLDVVPLNRMKPKDIGRVEEIWYNGNTLRSRHHYDDSRYHALNLHSVFSKGTIEFRLFNGTLHAGEIKSYIQFCLAISHQALVQTKASRRKTHSSNEKYTFRTWLLRLGLIGEEFKTARTHLLKNLDGCIAWKDPAQAEAQRERLKKKREIEREQMQEGVQNDSVDHEMNMQHM